MNACSIAELCEKNVINIENGCLLGKVDDVEVDTNDGRLCSIIIFGKSKLLGFAGRDSDLRIPWEDIKVIGDDTVLVKLERCEQTQRKPKFTPSKSFFG